jgi:hypothetical protein
LPGLPEELQRRETRIARIRKVQTSAGRASARASRERGERLRESATHGKTQYNNFTDPESRILKDAEGFVQGYKTQIAVELAFQLIVGQWVTQAANDKQQLAPLVERIEEQSGQNREWWPTAGIARKRI